MKVKRNIRLYARKRSGVHGDYLRILLRVSWSGVTIDFPTSVSVLTNEWNKERAMIVRREDANELNEILADLVQTVSQAFSEFEVIEKRVPNEDELRTKVSHLQGERIIRKKRDLSAYFALFIKDECNAHQWTKATVQRINNTKNRLIDWDATLTLASMTTEHLNDFVSWAVRKQYNNTTIVKWASFIRWFLRWCFRNGYYNGTAHETFRPKLKGTNYDINEIVFLTKDELSALMKCEYKQKHLERVRDVFVFACFCGLRFGDVCKLQKANIHHDAIHITTGKTTEHVTIELNTHTKAILQKYSENDSPFALPTISSQKTNEYLRTCCKEAGIISTMVQTKYIGNQCVEITKPKYQFITFHASRRTFITLSLLAGIPERVIIKWTGHKDVRMLKHYLEVVGELKEREMKKLDDLI